MAEKIIIANWKANKTPEEAFFWVEQVGEKILKFKRKIILCPSFVLLFPLFERITEMNLQEFLLLGSQDVSQFQQGAYTGEVPVEQIRDFVKFAIVGHSERRKYFGQTDQSVIQKVKLLIKFQITPILCISDLRQLDTYIKDGVIIENSDKIIFVYEPPEAISGGEVYHPDTPESANENAAKIKERIGKTAKTIYGGSINPENAHSFFAKGNIDGGLVGQASLDPQTFIRVVETTSN